MRPFLDEEEAKIIYAVLESLVRFCDRNRSVLAQEPIDAIAKSYRITLPQVDAQKEIVSTIISTSPELTEELLEIGMSDYSDENLEDLDPPIQEDFVPDGSLVTLTSLPGETIKQLKCQPKTHYQPLEYCTSKRKDTDNFYSNNPSKGKTID